MRRTLGDAIELDTVIADDLWNTLADRHHLQNVLVNLAVNARDAMDGAGKLTIEASNARLDADQTREDELPAGGEYVRITVTDTGSGMTPAVLERAFEPFFTTKTDGRGTGLGLSMAYGFLLQTGGSIDLQARSQGTTATLHLPRTLEEETFAVDIASDPVTGGTETVLVVEDDPDVRATAVDMLAQLGYRVLQTSDAQSALSVLGSGAHIDMLFTDVVMPGPVRSVELARRAKELIPSIEVLFTSGYTENGIAHKRAARSWRCADQQAVSARRAGAQGARDTCRQGDAGGCAVRRMNRKALRVLIVETMSIRAMPRASCCSCSARKYRRSITRRLRSRSSIAAHSTCC